MNPILRIYVARSSRRRGVKCELNTTLYHILRSGHRIRKKIDRRKTSSVCTGEIRWQLGHTSIPPNCVALHGNMECLCGLSEFKALALTGHKSIPCNATQFGGMLVWSNCDCLP